MTTKNPNTIYGHSVSLARDATILFLVACLVLVCGIPAGVCASPEIAVVDMLGVMNFHPDMSLNRKMLEKQIEEFDAEQREMQAKLDGLKKETDMAMAELQDAKLAEADRGPKMKQAQNKMTAYKEYEQKKRETAELRQNQITDQGVRMRQNLENKIRDIVRDYAKKNKFNLILDSSSAGGNGVKTTVYSGETVDITGKILKIIDPSRAE